MTASTHMTTGASASPRASSARLATTLAVTAVAFFMVVLDALVVVTALPSIHRSLGGSLGTLQWTVNAYNMAFGSGIVTAAALGDRLGRRRVYTAGLALFTAASAACALAPDVGLLITARAVQGLGAAVITPLSLTILSSAFPPERRGAIIGIWGGISGLGVAAGPLIGGVVTQGLSWHWVFWVNVPVGVAAVAATGGSARGRAVGPDRGPSADGSRPAAAGRRVRLDRGAGRLGFRLRRVPRAVHHRGRRRVDGHPDHPGRRAERRRPADTRHGIGDPEHAASVRRGIRHRDRDRDLQLQR
jgi:MFS family permease